MGYKAALRGIAPKLQSHVHLFCDRSRQTVSGCGKSHPLRQHYLTDWNILEVQKKQTSETHRISPRLWSRGESQRSGVVLRWLLYFQGGFSDLGWRSRYRPVVVAVCFCANEYCAMCLTKPRQRGHCSESEPCWNHWRQPHIAIIWMRRSLRRSQCSAAFAILSHGSLKDNFKTAWMTIMPQFLFSFSFFLVTVILIPSSQGLGRRLSEAWKRRQNYYSPYPWFSLAITNNDFYLPIIGVTNSSLNSLLSVLNPLPALNVHVSFF